jgi:hypothetical protein
VFLCVKRYGKVWQILQNIKKSVNIAVILQICASEGMGYNTLKSVKKLKAPQATVRCICDTDSDKIKSMQSSIAHYCYLMFDTDLSLMQMQGRQILNESIFML